MDSVFQQNAKVQRCFELTVFIERYECTKETSQLVLGMSQLLMFLDHRCKCQETKGNLPLQVFKVPYSNLKMPSYSASFKVKSALTVLQYHQMRTFFFSLVLDLIMTDTEALPC